MFTDRFIKLPVRLINTKMTDMDIYERGEDSFIMINPMEISQYYPVDEEGEDNKITKIIIKGDDEGTIIYLSVKEFEKVLNEYQK